VAGSVNWAFFLLLLTFVCTFAVMLSTWAILYEEKTFHKYKTRKEVLQLLGFAMLEPFFYHPLTVWWAVRGNFDYLRGVRSWGKMERDGFGKDQHEKRLKIQEANTVRQLKEAQKQLTEGKESLPDE